MILLRRLWRGTLLLLLPVLLYLGAAVGGALLPGSTGQATPDGDDARIDVVMVAGPIHYDFLLPLTPETRAAISTSGRMLPSASGGVAMMISGTSTTDAGIAFMITLEG